MFPKVYFTGVYFPGQYFEPVDEGPTPSSITQRLILIGTRNLLTFSTLKSNIGYDGLLTRKDDN